MQDRSRLEEIGITSTHDLNKNTISYKINTSADRFSEAINPLEFNNATKSVINAIYRDSKKTGGLENTSIELSGNLQNQFIDSLRELKNYSNSQETNLEDFKEKVTTAGGTLGAIILGAVAYHFGSECFTDIANKMNNLNEYAHYFAPITSLVQFFGTILTPGIGAIVGGLGGGTISLLGTKAYSKFKYPLANKPQYIEIFKKLSEKDEFKEKQN
jgi:hypothetical protein